MAALALNRVARLNRVVSNNSGRAATINVAISVRLESLVSIASTSRAPKALPRARAVRAVAVVAAAMPVALAPKARAMVSRVMDRTVTAKTVTARTATDSNAMGKQNPRALPKGKSRAARSRPVIVKARAAIRLLCAET